MGVEVTEAESDTTIQDFGDFHPTAKIGQLAPSVDYTKDISDVPLLLVQLTKLKCGEARRCAPKEKDSKLEMDIKQVEESLCELEKKVHQMLQSMYTAKEGRQHGKHT
ncbi:hypothetical protein FRX31_012749 [Thalictrum thalictroides]|uniref:Uncharacterized protein n=1 Tax=Thalictrum thalictroides TaxID=46969 RepID=A0A7J6WNH4_THATH|nr:hypothetical protein FRX31_012749 [Thalictrum thalictroides]